MSESQPYPAVAFPHEPTLALDPRSQQKLLELVQQIAPKRNTVVILCNHLPMAMEHVSDDMLILNLGQPVAEGSVMEIMSRVQRTISLQNYMRVQVPPAAVVETRQVLDGMPNILRLTHLNELEGWLEMELVPTSKRNSVNPYQVNRILSALIRAKIPIISFAPEAAHAQDMSLNLTSDVIR